MKSEFLQPRLEGARFAEHTLPLDVARDLAAYETLVVELAKRLYLRKHPKRQRVPKGFGQDFHLHIEKIGDGSTMPMLAVVAAGSLVLAGEPNDYFSQARDLINECVAAEETLPEAFPRELLTHFNQIGRALRDDERMELGTANGGTAAVLTPERRKRLVLAADKVYEREVELSGTIVEADWEKCTFRLGLADGGRVTVPMPEAFHQLARKYGGCQRHQVTIQGVATFDSWDRLQKVVNVETLDVQPDYEIAGRLDILRALENGWYDGQGTAPDQGTIDFVAEQLIGHYPEKLALPAIVPTPEGNLLFEWEMPGTPSVDLDLASLKAEFHAFGENGEDIERTFDLSEPPAWGEFFAYLQDNIGLDQA
jgi:hypothetical protein